MNTYQSNANRYKDLSLLTDLEGSDPHSLIDLLYKGILSNIARARGYMETNNFGKKGQEIGKALNIIEELRHCLDMENGGIISENLQLLYTYVVDILSKANIENNPAFLDEASMLISSVRESWNLIPIEQRHG